MDNQSPIGSFFQMRVVRYDDFASLLLGSGECRAARAVSIYDRSVRL